LVVLCIVILTPIVGYFINRWWPRKKAGDTQRSGADDSVRSQRVGRDSIVAGRDVQTHGDGTHIEVKERGTVGDVVFGPKYETYIHEPAPTIAAQALHQLPPPPADFTGREGEIKELLGAVKEKGVTISGLRRMGGIGKTALALKLAEKLSQQYPDAQIFLDLRGVSEKPASAAEALTRVLHAFYPEAKLPESEAELANLYRSTLHAKRVVLVMDNARDAAQVAPLLPPAGSALIVTSRFYLDVPGLRVKDLGTLPPEDARNLLITIACGPDALASDVAPVPPRRDRRYDRCAAILAQADEIARLCGYLPLALRSAASTLAKRIDVTPQTYAMRLAEGREKLDEVEASLSSSYDLLGGELQMLFRTLGVFPGTFDAPAAAAAWELGTEPAQAALGDLLAYSLLEWDAGLERYRLHDLVRLFAQHMLTQEERERAARRHAQHYAEVLRKADVLYMQGGEAIKSGLALYDLEVGNIKAGQAWAAAHAAKDEEAARLCSDYPDAGACCLGLRQHPRERIEWLVAALAAARRLKEPGGEGVHLGNLGLAYAHLGEPRRAIEYSEEYLAIAREITDRRGEGAALGSLGLAYADLGETRRAIEYYERWLAIACEIGDRRGEGQALGNLGVAYADLGETRRAIECYEKTLAIHRDIGDRRGEGQDLGNLGLAYADLGETRRAIEYYEQQLTITREISDRRGEGAALGNLGLVYADLGEPRRAIECHEKPLAIDREIGDRRGEGQALGNLGNAYAVLGETRRAIEYHERALAIDREIGDQRGEGQDLGNLGNAYAGLGETRHAIEYYEKALAIAREIGDRRGEGNALYNMSLALDKRGERAQAIAHAEAALEIYEQIEDPNAEKVRKQLKEWGR
jgi:tetratricopeptide (TPR) repeat protein